MSKTKSNKLMSDFQGHQYVHIYRISIEEIDTSNVVLKQNY
jgi:hypothetical protein